MKIKTVDEAFIYGILHQVPVPEGESAKASYVKAMKFNRALFSMAYRLGVATVLLGQSTETLEDLLADQWIKDNLITEDSDATS